MHMIFVSHHIIPHIQQAGIIHDNLLFVLSGIALVASFLLYSRIRLIAEKTRMLRDEKNKYKKLLFSILPKKVAIELSELGHIEPKRHENVTILFTDFVGFTTYSETAKPLQLVKSLDEIFSMFDSIILHQNVEKIKTIGDSYMCAAGLPDASPTHAEDLIRVALEFREYIALFRHIKKQEGIDFPDIRIGLHTGPVVAGVIGVSRTSYDVWGDTVNTAKRMENTSEGGRVNISEALYLQVKDKFNFTSRGIVNVKGKSPMTMYFVESEIGSAEPAITQEAQSLPS